MQIAILGKGNVGSALGSRWAQLGHSVVYGVRQPNGRGNVVEIEQAVRSAEVVVLAVPWAAAKEVLSDAGSLAGKVLIDCTNPLLPGLAGLEVGLTTSAAEQIAEWAPGASVFKALNQTGSDNMVSSTGYVAQPVIFVCGNDEASKPVVMELVREVGFDAVDAGDLSVARLLEPLAMLWIHLAYKKNLGRNIAFVLSRR